ncbi:hypothetical protein ACFCYN_14940 [Gottfriedia sp. NPDC056225]|uniref:hypothetical protein n=1 Tax=Gottfriedia sp. NPDC056225 TaxID=3345751 RepID=UPI0035E1D151
MDKTKTRLDNVLGSIDDLAKLGAILEEDLTAEKYGKMSPMERLVLHTFWSVTSAGETKFTRKKIEFFDKPLHVFGYRVFDKHTGRLIGEYNSVEQISKSLNMDTRLVNYLLYYSNRSLVKSKYQAYYDYMISEVRYELKGNDYIESVGD